MNKNYLGLDCKTFYQEGLEMNAGRKGFMYLQFWKMNMAPLVNKPYVNEVTLNEQNMYSKSC